MIGNINFIISAIHKRINSKNNNGKITLKENFSIFQTKKINIIIIIAISEFSISFLLIVSTKVTSYKHNMKVIVS